MLKKINSFKIELMISSVNSCYLSNSVGRSFHMIGSPRSTQSHWSQVMDWCSATEHIPNTWWRHRPLRGFREFTEQSFIKDEVRTGSWSVAAAEAHRSFDLIGWGFWTPSADLHLVSLLPGRHTHCNTLQQLYIHTDCYLHLMLFK